MRSKLNTPLAEWVKAHPSPVIRPKSRQNVVVYRATKWRFKDRLTEVDIVRLVMAFQTGMTTKELAERYGINVKSVRKVLRERGIERSRWNDAA